MRIVMLAGVMLALCACDSDPGKGKEQAQVGSAAPVASVADFAAFGELKIDPSSTIAFVGANPTNKHNGGFKSFTGAVKLADGKAEGGAVAVEIDMNSVFTDDEDLTTHLKSKDFYQVDKFAKSSFVSTKVAAGGAGGATHTITGNLTVKNKMRSISFPATVKLDGNTVTVTADFAINRKDFEIDYGGAADALIQDNVAIKLNVIAKK
jgi:polyisoprenoid-binding protein YceI